MNWYWLAAFAPSAATVLGALYGRWRRPQRVMPTPVALAVFGVMLCLIIVPLIMPMIWRDWLDPLRPPDAFHHPVPFIYVWPVFVLCWTTLSFGGGARIAAGAPDILSKAFAVVVVLVAAALQGFVSIIAALLFSCALGAGCT